MIFPWSLSNNKSPKVFRILLSILTDLSYTVVWIVSFHPLISKSSSPFINLLVIVPRALIIIIIIIVVHSLELFTSAIADGFSLKSEWQQVSSSLQDSS